MNASMRTIRLSFAARVTLTLGLAFFAGLSVASAQVPTSPMSLPKVDTSGNALTAGQVGKSRVVVDLTMPPPSSLARTPPSDPKKWGLPTGVGAGTVSWDAAKAAQYLKMVEAGQKEIIEITGTDSTGGFLTYRRVLGVVAEDTSPGLSFADLSPFGPTALDADTLRARAGPTVLNVSLDAEYTKSVGPWNPAGPPPHPYAKP